MARHSPPLAPQVITLCNFALPGDVLEGIAIKRREMKPQRRIQDDRLHFQNAR